MKHLNFVLLRSPSFSLNQINNKAYWKSDLFNEGLFLSSKELYNDLISPQAKDPKKQARINQSLVKYWTRTCSRCTPYGTFAGNLVVDLKDEPTELTLHDNNLHERKVRLDMGSLSSIIEKLLTLPSVRENITVFPNDSLYETGEEFRYVEFVLDENVRDYKLSSVQKTDYLAAILLKCKDGATMRDLAEHLSILEEVDYDDAIEYVTDLWNSQIIISSLEPNITGEDPLKFLIEKLQGIGIPVSILEKLNKIQVLIDHPKPGVNYLLEIENELDFFSVDLKNSIHVDLFLSAKSHKIELGIIDNILLQLDKLLVLKKSVETYDLKTFKNKFRSKYGSESIPLALAIDSDIGIGYSHLSEGNQEDPGLLDKLNFSQNTSFQKDYGVFDYIQKFALIKYSDCILKNKKIIEITNDDLKEIEDHTKDLKVANSLYTMGSLHSLNGKIDSENFLYDLNLIGGPCAGSLLGRFAYNNKRLLKAIKESSAEEEKEYPDAIYAEIVHLPQARVGNIVQRPIFRRYEIPYLGKSGIDKEFQIEIQDLNVSIEGDQVVLRSIKHNRRVIPRLTTAHNFMIKSLPLYKFLCDLQTQGNSYAKFWDWGTLNIMSHLPRVMYKNIIIVKEQWLIKKTEIVSDGNGKVITPKLINDFLLKNEIPDKVAFVEGGDEFLFDLSETDGINLLVHYLEKYNQILIKEYLFTEENCIVRNTEGQPFTNEIIIPITREVAPQPDMQRPEITYPNETKFSLGSEWLYFKIYAGNNFIYQLLTEILLPFLEKSDKVLFEKFFFIRYNDTGTHIRLRFYNSDLAKQYVLQQKISDLLSPFYIAGKITNILIDTYERENNRYDKDLIDHAETIFHNDSLFVIKLLREFGNEKLDIPFYLECLRSIDRLMDDFDFGLNDKHELLDKMQHAFFTEFNGSKFLQRQLNDKYRVFREKIFRSFKNDPDLAKSQVSAILQERSEINAIPVVEIFKALDIVRRKETLFKLLPSYIHMSVNRMFASNQRKQELLIYHLLERHYKSALSIKNSVKKSKLIDVEP